MSIDTMELDTAEKIAAIPIDEIDVSRPSLFQQDTIGLFFDRLRKEEPVHYCRESHVGPFWSITKFDDIMAVDTNHKVFSSEAKLGGIATIAAPEDCVCAGHLAVARTAGLVATFAG